MMTMTMKKREKLKGLNLVAEGLQFVRSRELIRRCMKIYVRGVTAAACRIRLTIKAKRGRTRENESERERERIRRPKVQCYYCGQRLL